MNQQNQPLILFLFISLVFTSCKSQKILSYNHSLLEINQTGEVFFKAPNFLKLQANEDFDVTSDSLLLKYVHDMQGNKVKINKDIDVESFAQIPVDDLEKEQINNVYYLYNPLYNYFRDKNFVYLYNQEQTGQPQLVQAGKVNDYQLLGGAYIQINNQIYWRGQLLPEVDVNNFKVLNVQRRASEWEASLGLDGKHIFIGASPIETYDDFNQTFKKSYFLSDDLYDSLSKTYFPNN